MVENNPTKNVNDIIAMKRRTSGVAPIAGKVIHSARITSFLDFRGAHDEFHDVPCPFN